MCDAESFHADRIRGQHASNRWADGALSRRRLQSASRTHSDLCRLTWFPLLVPVLFSMRLTVLLRPCGKVARVLAQFDSPTPMTSLPPYLQRNSFTPFEIPHLPRRGFKIIVPTQSRTITYDHRYWKTRDPVRSPIDKPIIASLSVGAAQSG
jgi:hypothetical protein